MMRTNKNRQIKLQEKLIQPQLKYLNIESNVFTINKLVQKEDLYLDTINNKNKDILIESKSIEKYNSNKEKFLNDIIKINGILTKKYL